MTLTATELIVSLIAFLGLILGAMCFFAWAVSRPFHQYYCRMYSQHEEAVRAERKVNASLMKAVLAERKPDVLQQLSALGLNGVDEAEVPDHSQGAPSRQIARFAAEIAKAQREADEGIEMGPVRPTGPGFGE